MLNGVVKWRQGGNTGDNDWPVTGTTNTDTSAKDVKIQVGYIASSSGGGLAVTFPEAFSKAPLVFVTVNSGSNGFWAQCDSVPTTTGFSVTAWSSTGSLVAKLVSWMAIGQ